MEYKSGLLVVTALLFLTVSAMEIKGRGCGSRCGGGWRPSPPPPPPPPPSQDMPLRPPSSLGKIDGKQFYIQYGSRMKNYTDAVSVCDEFDMELASIENKQQADFVGEGLRRYQGYTLWTSAIELRPNTGYIWASGALADETIFYRVIDETQTANVDDSMKCGEVYSIRQGLYFKKGPCSRRMNAVLCEKDAK